MKPAAFSRMFVFRCLASRAGLVAVAALLIGASCAKGPQARGASASTAASATGAYEFVLATHQPGQRLATMLSRETARAIVEGTGMARTDRASFMATCEHQLIAVSGPVITKFDVQCKAATTGTSVSAAASEPSLTGSWTHTDGLRWDASPMGWQLKNDVRPAVLYVSPRVLEALFGGVWQPGATRQVPSSRQLWQLISPELSDVRGDDAPATVQFVGVVDSFATFTYRSTLKHDDLVVEISGSVVLDKRTGWPSRLTVQADSGQDMAKVSLKVEKTITAQP